MSSLQFFALILIASTLIQVSAAVAAFRLIRVTGRITAWVLVSLAMVLMAARRILLLYWLLTGSEAKVNFASESLGLAISILLFSGILLIGGLFRSIQAARDKLDRSTRRLQEASISGRVALWEWNIAAGTMEWSQAVDEMLGFPPNGFPRTYRAWEACIHADDLPNVQQAIRRNFETNAPYDVVYRIQRADGVHAWWHEVGHVTRDQNGSPISMAGSSVDITERKLREAEYATILQTAIDGFFVASARTGRLLDVNDAYCTLVGYTRAELLGMRIADLDLNESPGELAAHLQRILRAGHERFETRHRTKDGRALDLLASVTFLAGANRVCVFVSDVTERKRNETALHARLAEIERFNRLTTARERRMVELKRQVNRCAAELGRPPPYAAPGEPEPAPGPDPAAAAPPRPRPALPAPALEELLDRRQLQALLDHFSAAVGVSTAIIDPQGTVFVGANWQPVCTAFHRINERAWTRCVESDTVLAAQLAEGKKYTLYRCLNGLNMAAAPITVENRAVASFFLSQFLCEPPDLAHFRRQAAEFGFDEGAYLAALARVPVLSQERLQPLLEFLANGAGMLSQIAQDRHDVLRHSGESSRVAEELRQQREAALNLAQDAMEAHRSLESSEEALRLSRDMLAQILDTVPQAVFWKDRASVCIGCNRVFATAFGFGSAADVIGKSDFELFSSRADAEAYRADDREVMESNRPKRHIIESAQRRDGSRFWVDTTKLPLVDSSGRVYGVLGVFEDITVRLQAEEQLREQEARHRFALDTVGAGEWEVQLPSREARRSPQHARIFGYEPPLPPWSLAAFLGHVVPEDRDRVHAAVEAAIRQGHDVEFECRIARTDAARRWIWVCGRHIPAERKESQRLAGIVIDITERKQAEVWLRQSEERQHLVLTATEDAIWDWQPEQHQLYWSPRLTGMLGYAPDEVEPSVATWEDLLHPEDRAAAKAMLQQCIRGQRDDYRHEVRLRTREGNWLWVLIRGRVLARGQRGEVLRMAGTHTDITLRKRAEETLQAQLQELQRWQNVMLGREQRVLDLKREVNVLHRRLNEPASYASVAEAEDGQPPPVTQS